MKVGVKMSKYGIIYKITNKINGKVYIGQTVRERGFKGRYECSGEGIERVYKYHKSEKEHNRNYNKHLLYSIEKYGFEAFEVIEEFDVAYSKEELDELEKKYIKDFNCLNPNGYNNDEGGNEGKFCEESRRLLSEKNSGENNPFYGKKHSEETKKKMSEARKGKCVGEKHPMYGKHQSEETKEKNRQAHLKENLSEETRIKMSTKAKQRTGLKNHISKPVWCEELKEVRPSGKEWAKELKLSQSSVSQCCNGKRNHTGGYHFRFAKKEEIEKYKKERGEK